MKKHYIIIIAIVIIIISAIFVVTTKKKEKNDINDKNFNYWYDESNNKYFIYKADGTLKDVISPEEFENYEYDQSEDYIEEIYEQNEINNTNY